MKLQHCTLCPKACGADRTRTAGWCGGGAEMRAARAALHFWEEPCISGKGGAGAVFFSGCALRCCFCQNRQISQEWFGKAISVSQLSEILLRLQEQGAETLDLVTGSHYAPWIAESLRQVKPQLHIPVVWNSSGYDSPEILSLLNGLVDVYLPDWKYLDNATAEQYSGISDYCTVTEQAISEMVRQVGTPVLNHGILQHGVLIRHLILPGQRHASMALLRKIAATFPNGQVWVSLMGQYTPAHHNGISKRFKSRTGIGVRGILAGFDFCPKNLHSVFFFGGAGRTLRENLKKMGFLSYFWWVAVEKC